MRHEWRSNLWLILELLIVSGILCYVMFLVVSKIAVVVESKGFDDNDVYVLDIKSVGKDSPEYVDLGEDTDLKDMDDLKTLLHTLRNHTLVEAVSLSGGATPYSMNYMGNQLKVVGSEDSVFYSGNLRMASPDIVRVLRTESAEGMSLKDQEDALRRGEMLISVNNGYDRYRSTAALKGETAFLGRDSTAARRVGGILLDIKRMTYEPSGDGMFLVPINEGNPSDMQYCSEILIRVKAGEGKRFAESFNSDRKMQRLRNIYLSQLRPLKNLKYATERSSDVEMRMNLAFIGFLLVIIFLGLLGSFWYRVQQRIGEIAIRKVSGATDSDIFRRFISEGTLLLLAGFILGAILYLFVFYKLIKPSLGIYFDYSILWIELALTYAVMQIIIILGIWFPARKAMRIEPALALKEE